jgi:hypothetical protein
MYDRAWFEEVLATVKLHPEDAVDAAPSATALIDLIDARAASTVARSPLPPKDSPTRSGSPRGLHLARCV